MKLFSRIALIVVAAIATLAATGCPQQRSIGEINANPGRYQNKEVIITGRVVDSYGLNIPGFNHGGGAYEIDDGTGVIWISTNEPVPARGAQIGIEGTVSSGVTMGGRNFGLGINEEKRRFHGR